MTAYPKKDMNGRVEKILILNEGSVERLYICLALFGLRYTDVNESFGEQSGSLRSKPATKRGKDSDFGKEYVTRSITKGAAYVSTNVGRVLQHQTFRASLYAS